MKLKIKGANLIGILFPIAMVIPNIFFDYTEQMSFLGKIANVVVPLSIYMLLMTVAKRLGIIILSLFIMIVMNSFQLVVLYLYGESIIAIDMLLNCLTTNPSEASELLSNLGFPILCDAILYIPFIGWAIYAVIKKVKTTENFRKDFRRYGLIGLAIGIMMVIIATLTSEKYAVNRDLYPINVISNIGSALGRTYDSVNYHKTSADYTFDAVDTHDPDDREIYVLVIGETSRADNWQLFGYDRETNPNLSKRDDIVAFNRAVSQSNTTHKCVPMMLTETVPATFDSIMYRKSVITAFKEAGYETSFFSNQAKNHSYTQFFGEEADNVKYLSAKDHYDRLLVDTLKAQLSDTLTRKQLVVLHTYGSHFNYKERYPDSLSYFKPDASSEANVKHRQELLNAYDNTIRYTDAMLSDIISLLEQSGAKSVMIYSSDHGEDIFDDDRERFLHASPVPTYYQIHVPMIVWSSESYRQSYSENVEALKGNSRKYVAPSQSIFFTLLDLAGIETKHDDDKQSFANEDYVSPRPVYLNDYNEAVPLEDSGLKDEDLKNLKDLKIL